MVSQAPIESRTRSRRAPLAAALAVAMAVGVVVAQGPVKSVSGRGQIRGEVQDTSGTPLVGISIVLSPSSRPDLLYATSTDEKGRYAFNGLVPDIYEVRADGQGYESAIKERIRVRPPFRAHAIMKLEAAGPTANIVSPSGERTESGQIGVLDGTFLDADGQPVLEGAIVMRRVGHAQDTFYAVTDRSGSFHLTGVPAGLYNISTRSPGLIPLHLRARQIPAQDSFHVQLVAPRYPLTFKGWIDDLLPEERPLPPPAPRIVEMSLESFETEVDPALLAEPGAANDPTDEATPAADVVSGEEGDPSGGASQEGPPAGGATPGEPEDPTAGGTAPDEPEDPPAAVEEPGEPEDPPAGSAVPGEPDDPPAGGAASDDPEDDPPAAS